MNKLSDIYNRKIYDENSAFIGTSKDVLIDPQEGRIKYLLKADAEKILDFEREDAKSFMREHFIPFEKVTAVRDVILIHK